MAERGHGFIARWSYLKTQSREAGVPSPREEEPLAPEEEEFDVSCLPSLDSLSANSDFTAFMRKGVPKALRLAALRKAWTLDPAIRDYKTFADYDWDCNAPGYAQLRVTDDPTKMVGDLFRHLRSEVEPAAEAPSSAKDADAQPTQEVGDGPEGERSEDRPA